MAKPTCKARQWSSIAAQIWYPIDLRKFGCDDSVRSPAHSSIQTLGEGAGSPETTRRGWWMLSFLGGKSRGAFGQLKFFFGGKSHDHRRFWKRGFFKKLKFLSLFSKTIVRQYWSCKLEKKKHVISVNGKKRFKRILVEGEKFKLRKLPSKDLPCSETQPSKWSF